MKLTATAINGYPEDAPLPDACAVTVGVGGPVVGSATFRRDPRLPTTLLADIDVPDPANLTQLTLAWSMPPSMGAAR